MTLVKKVHKVGTGPKNPEIFHKHFGRFSHSLNFLKFINDYSGNAYHSVFAEWEKEYTKNLANLDSKSKKEYEKILKMYKKPPKKVRSHSVKSSKVQQILGNRDIHSFIHNNMPIFINESCILYLVILFEKFLKDTLKLLLEKEPRGLMQSNKELRIKDIGASKTMNEILAIAISKEIESVIDGGIDQILDYLKKHNLNLEKYQNWSKFREVFFRRNVIVHNSGYPNQQYCEKMGKKISLKRLTVSHSYVNTSLKLFDDYAHIITDYFETKYTPKKLFSHSKPEVFMKLGTTIF